MAYTKFFLCISVVAMLIACGDNSSSADAIVIDTSFDVSESDMVVATKGELPECTDKRDGAIAYVKDKKAAYICDDGRWVLDNEGGTSSSSSKAKSSSSSGKEKSSSSSAKAKSSSSGVKEESSSSSAKTGSSSSSDVVRSSSSDKSSSSVNENPSGGSENKPYDGELWLCDSTGCTYDYYKYDEVLNKWAYSSEDEFALKLNGCTHKRDGEMGLSPKDNSHYTCECFVFEQTLNLCEWRKSQEIDFIKRDNKCESEDVGRIVAGIDTITNKYYCSLIGWVNMETWSFGVPPEFRFNQDINYGSLTDDRDGKTYKTVKIGDQVWMAENLNYAGDGIGHCYDDVPEYCDVAGRLYKWDVARGVCPEGWHLPSKAEFDTLLSVVKLEYGEECSLADMFRATSGWSYGGQGCDKTGFSAVPAGGKHIEAYRQPEYNHAGSFAFFLTSTENGEHSVYVLALYSNDVSLIYDFDEYDFISYSTKDAGLSVRCLQDAE